MIALDGVGELTVGLCLHERSLTHPVLAAAFSGRLTASSAVPPAAAGMNHA